MYWNDISNYTGREVILHSCHRGSRQFAPKLSSYLTHGFYEDGFFRGLRRGRKSAWFPGSPYDYHVLKCKACGEIAKLDDADTVIE